MKNVRVRDALEIGEGQPLAFIAGPCVIESREHCLRVAGFLAELATRLDIPLIFKASYDKANRTAVASFRGPGLEEGLRILDDVRGETGLPILTDVHSPEEARTAGEVVDVLQTPAFLCRQTDLLVAAGATGRPVNVKKGQFMHPEGMALAAEKVESGAWRVESDEKASPSDSLQTRNEKRETRNEHRAGCVLLCERGSCFGYNNLVVDMRGLEIMRSAGYPVVFDATHSVQHPGGAGRASGGDRRYVPVLARAAVAAGVDAVFLEVHDDPDRAPSDGPNMWPLGDLEALLRQLLRIREAV